MNGRAWTGAGRLGMWAALGWPALALGKVEAGPRVMAGRVAAPGVLSVEPAGSPARLRALYAGLLAATVPDDDGRGEALLPAAFALRNSTPARAAAELLEAARLHPGQPPAFLDAASHADWRLFVHAPPEARAGLVRLLGCWGLEEYAACALVHLEPDAGPDLIDAVFESLRLFKSPATADLLEAFFLPDNAAAHPFSRRAVAMAGAALRRKAFLTLAARWPRRAVPHFEALMKEAAPADLPSLWRELLTAGDFAPSLAVSMPRHLSKAVLESGRIAARQAGAKGAPLRKVLSRVKMRG